jgi:hypothetical protein
MTRTNQAYLKEEKTVLNRQRQKSITPIRNRMFTGFVRVISASLSVETASRSQFHAKMGWEIHYMFAWKSLLRPFPN